MTPTYTIHEAATPPPAMPFGRVAAIGLAPFARPGRLMDLYFDKSCRRVMEGRVPRAVRFDLIRRCLPGDLVVEIDPGCLTHELADLVDDRGASVRLSHWFLDGGDWRQAVRPLRLSEVQQEIDAVFDFEGRLEESPAFRALLAKSEAGRPAVRNRVSLMTPTLIRSYLEQYVELRRSIERHGFRRRAGVPSATARLFAGTAVRDRAAEAAEREVGLAVGPGGRLLRLSGGRHRTAIAQRLELARIPAQVRLVHARWLGRWIARTGLPPRQALVAGLRHTLAGQRQGEQA